MTGVWAGLRPLLSAKHGHRVSERTADLSRRHKVWRDADGVVTVTGGKLTTFRKMAEDTVDLVVKGLGGPARRCVTKSLQLEGSPGLAPSKAAPGPELPPHLEHRYGTLAARVMALADDRPTLLQPVVDGLPYLGVEVLHAVREEMAVHVGDVLSRRTRASIQDARASIRSAGAVAALMADELDWDDARTSAEASGFIESVEAELETAGVASTEGAVRSDAR